MITTDDIDRIKRGIPGESTPSEIMGVIYTFEDFLRRNGYTRCNIPVCNCGSWHGGHASNRLHELHTMLQEMGVDLNGKTLSDVVRELALTSGYADH